MGWHGEIVPLPVEIYPLAEAKTAFRRMQQARHVGKIVLQMPSPLQPREDRSYLITGGLGALGLHTAAYLAQLGAGDIVLASRRPPDPAAQQAIDEMTERYHCRIHTFAADVADEAQVCGLLAAHAGGAAATCGCRTPGGCDRRCPATTAEPGTVPHDAGPKVLRRLASASVDQERRSRVLHRVLVRHQRARSARPGQLRHRQRDARRARLPPQGAGPARD